MAEKLISIVSTAPVDQYRKKNDDDFSDRLSSKYTVAVLVMFAIVVGMTQYVGEPIVCWCPSHFHGSWVEFTNSYCWVKNTYFLPWEYVVPHEHDFDGEVHKEHIQYYQWIPFILIVQAILFYLPTAVWHALNSRGGIDADSILECSYTLSMTEKIDQRDKNIRTICNAMNTFLATKKKHNIRANLYAWNIRGLTSILLCKPLGQRFGNYLSLLFLTSKVCYLVNCIGQFFLLNALFGQRFTRYGLIFMQHGLEEAYDWDDNYIVAFPRVTMCDFAIRRLGNINRFSVQCVLPINLYNEKIYLFLWFWMIFVTLVSLSTFSVWVIRFIWRGDRLKFIHNHLKQYDLIKTEKDYKKMENFLDKYLKQDGAFLLRLIAHNTNNITVTEITCGLWDVWEKGLNTPKHIKNDDVDSEMSVEDDHLIINDDESHSPEEDSQSEKEKKLKADSEDSEEEEEQPSKEDLIGTLVN